MRNQTYKKTISAIHSVRYGGLPTHYPSIIAWDSYEGETDFSESLKRFSLEKGKEPFGIYVHIPFCKTKCRFCFLDILCDINRQDEYASLLLKEFEFFSSLGFGSKKVDTIYIGGGTPNIFSAENIDKILKGLKNNFNLSPLTQITMESNPGFWDSEKIRILKKYGVDVVIMGVQSFDEDTSLKNNRSQDLDSFYDFARRFRKNGIKINIDLLLGLTDEEKFKKDLEFVSKMLPDQIHVNRIKPLKGTFSEVEKNKLKQMQNEAFSFLSGFGYLRIDEDSCSLKIYKGRNINVQCDPRYQIYSSILGLGMGAMGHLFSNCRYRNTLNFEKYKKCLDRGLPPVSRYSRISETDEITHYCLSRISNGFLDLADMKKKFSVESVKKMFKKIEKAVKAGLMEPVENGFEIKGDVDFFGITKSFYDVKYLKKIAKKFGF